MTLPVAVAPSVRAASPRSPASGGRCRSETGAPSRHAIGSRGIPPPLSAFVPGGVCRSTRAWRFLPVGAGTGGAPHRARRAIDLRSGSFWLNATLSGAVAHSRDPRSRVPATSRTHLPVAVGSPDSGPPHAARPPHAKYPRSGIAPSAVRPVRPGWRSSLACRKRTIAVPLDRLVGRDDSVQVSRCRAMPAGDRRSKPVRHAAELSYAPCGPAGRVPVGDRRSKPLRRKAT